MTYALTRPYLRAVSILSLLGLSLGCLAEVDGDRAATGECPPGETCSDSTPAGLIFVGRALFDDSTLRLGPVVVGGTFELGLRTVDGTSLPDYRASSGGAFAISNGAGVFGPTDDEGAPLYAVDSHVTLRAVRPGGETIRIADSTNGALFDRVEIEAVAMEGVDIVVARDEERDHLYAGCEEMVGIRIVADNGTTQIRAFDQEMQVRANGTPLEEEALFWDCVVYPVGEDETSVRVDVDIAGSSFSRTFSVGSLADDGLTTCPRLD